MSSVELERHGGVTLCRIDSPETRNALDAALLTRVAEALETADLDPETRCIVLTGGDEVFASGPHPASLAGAVAAPDPAIGGLWERIGSIGTPIVAGISGWALAAGFELALACDVIVAADDARFGLPEVTLGLIPSGGATQRLVRALGKQRTMELVLTGRHLEADQAFDYGLVNILARKRSMLEKALIVGGQIADRGPVAVRLAKQAILAAEREGIDRGTEIERELYARALATEDRVEGVQALLEGRPPDFSGR